MIIDSHSHVYLPIPKLIDLMDLNEIDKTILFISTVHPELTANFADMKTELTKLMQIVGGEIDGNAIRIEAMNNLAEIINEYPQRFDAFGYVPIGLSEIDTFNWIEKYIFKTGFKGIGEITLQSGQVSKTENIFKIVSESFEHLPLWFHTFHPLNYSDIFEIIMLARKYSKAKVILGHGGGSFWLNTVEEIKNDKNIFFDISATFNRYSLTSAVENFPERVLFSIDMPYGIPKVMKSYVEDVVSDKSLQRLIYSENISRILY